MSSQNEISPAEIEGPKAKGIYVSVPDGREGWMHFNKQYSEEYFQQLTAENVTISYERGVEIRKYVNPKAVRNEALDIEVGNLAALRLHPRNFDTIEAELKTRAKELQGAATPKHRPEPKQERRGFGHGWNL